MELIVAVFVLLVGGLRPADGEEHTGVAGDVVVIRCSHSNAHSNVKYFCREPCKNEDVLVTSQETKPDGKYTIKDEGNMFLVTISDLEIKDSGAYRCGIERIGVDTFKRVVLNVREDSQRKARRNDLLDSLTMEGNNEMGPLSRRKLLYVGSSLGVVMLALIVVLLIFFRHRRISRGSTTCGKVTDTVYTTPSCLKEDAQRSVTPSSCQTASQCEAADEEASRGGGQVDNIYFNIDNSAEPRTQLEELCYTAVSFTMSPPGSPVASIAESYSIIRYLPQDEQSVYSNV